MSFAERYQITSKRGRVYTREMLLNAATRCWLARTSKVAREKIAAVLEAMVRGLNTQPAASV